MSAPEEAAASTSSSNSGGGGAGNKEEGQEPGPLSEEDIQKYEGLFQTAKSKVEALRVWKETVDQHTPEFIDAYRQAFGYLTAAFSILRDDQKFFNLADELASEIVDMRNHLGLAIMPLDKFYVFGRGTFQVGSQTVLSAQYYEEIPFYGPPVPIDDSSFPPTKFYEWKVVDVPKDQVESSTPVKEVYYLESGWLNTRQDPYYVLGLSAPGMHATLANFKEKPSFFSLELMIVKRLFQKQHGQQPSVQAVSQFT